MNYLQKIFFIISICQIHYVLSSDTSPIQSKTEIELTYLEYITKKNETFPVSKETTHKITVQTELHNYTDHNLVLFIKGSYPFYQGNSLTVSLHANSSEIILSFGAIDEIIFYDK